MAKEGKGTNHGAQSRAQGATSKRNAARGQARPLQIQNQEIGVPRLPPSSWDSPRLERGGGFFRHRDPPEGERHVGTDIGGGPPVK